MRINLVSPEKILQANTQRLKFQINKNADTTSYRELSLTNLPNYNYMINFGSRNENLESLYNYFGNGHGMPITYNTYLSQMPKEEREKITDVYANYKSVYSEMEDCHTTEELKEKFPNEFARLQSALAQKDSKGSFTTQVNNWAKLFINSGEYLFPETKDNDLSVYLAKKIYLEAKTKKEINEDFINDLNHEILSEEDIAGIKSYQRKSSLDEVIPTSVYGKLGLVGDFSANGFRNSLCRSRQEYIDKYGSIYKEKRKATFEKALQEVTENIQIKETSIPRKNSTNYEKYQYAMYYVWNDSMDLRKALSDFLIQNSLGNELLKGNFMENASQKADNQKNIMLAFWEQNPELRTDFADKCKEAFDIVEAAIDKGQFEDLKKSIDSRRQAVYEIMKLEKEKKEETIEAEKQRILAENLRKAQLAQVQAEYNAHVDKIKKQVQKLLDNKSKTYPIPDSQKSQITNKLTHYILDTIKTHDDILNIPNILGDNIEIIKMNVGDALCTTFFDKFETVKKEVIAKCCTIALQEDPILSKLPVEIRIDKTTEEIKDVARFFIEKLFCPYMAFLMNYPAKDIPKEARKKFSNQLYNECINDDRYKTICSTKSAQYMFKEFRKVIFDAPPQELITKYKGQYINMQKKYEQEI